MSTLPTLPSMTFLPLRSACAFLCLGAALAGCGNQDGAPKPGQALVSVNGEEITALQLNDELQRANVQAAQQDVASKQLLEGLIDRQLLQNAAHSDKTDRDPKVVQAIERAKALIIAQAYMQKKIGNGARPSSAEVSDYFARNPDFFSNRKQFDMQQLVIDTKDLTEQVKAVADKANSLDDVALWFDANQVKYLRAQSSRTSSDLAPELSAKLKSMPKGKLFVVKEGERSMLVSIVDVKDKPVTLAVAAPQIEKFLINTRNKAAADAEVARLRALAKIDYLQQATALAAAGPAVRPAMPAAAPAVAAGGAGEAATARGVAGLK